MSPQLAEAQQPPSIVERADRFANPSPLQPVKTDFRTEFVVDAVEGQIPPAAIQGSGLTPAVMKLLQERPPRPDVYDPAHPEAFDPGSLIAVQSASRPEPASTGASAQAAQHIQRLASCIVANAGGERFSGEQVARQIGRL